MSNINTNPEMNAAIVAALAETTDIQADSKNSHLGNKYASLSAHLKAIKPILAKHGLALVQAPIYDTAGGLGINSILLHKNGGWISFNCCVNAPQEKGKDKNGNEYEKRGFTPQQGGALISYLRRYTLASVGGVATDDDDANLASQPAAPATRTWTPRA